MALDKGKARFRILRLALGQPHRYRRRRAVTMALSVAVLFAVPLSGLARLDLWYGDHLAVFRSVDLVKGLIAVGGAVIGFYLFTFMINVPAGRMFCGFGCPIGQLSRFGDAIDAHERDVAKRKRAWGELVAFAGALSLAFVLWMFTPRTLIAPEPLALVSVYGLFAVMLGLAILHARGWRWGFCKKLCPIGLYYSVVQTNSSFVEVSFDPNAPCTDCNACATICPVDLDPRHLDTVMNGRGGLSLDGFAAANHCLHCGDCIVICEHQTRKTEGPAPMGFRRPKPEEVGLYHG